MNEEAPLVKRPVDGFIFDLDGTVYLGEAALPGSVDAIAELRRRGKNVLFVSNKPLEPREAYAAKLTKLGIPATPDDVITSGYVMGHYLAHHEPTLRLYVVGEENLRTELQGHGLSIVEEMQDQDAFSVIDPTGIDGVIVAFDRTLDYRKLNTAYQALMRGARFFATNADKMCPMPGGGIPDAGGTIAALEHMTGRTVDVLAGKPSSLIMQVAMERLGLPAHLCMMTGDRLETDILMGQRAGMVTTVTLTGASTREQALEMANPPDLIVNNLYEIIDLVD
jgi:phosphoglycolate/pyridoxal phosphate phosphatase family enzyme